MLNKYQKPLAFLVGLVWVIGFAFLVGRATQNQDDRNQVEVAKRACDAVERQTKNDCNKFISQLPLGQKTANESEKSRDIKFLGVSPGEALLAFISCLLWLATRDLVNGSREASERDLRAYLGPGARTGFRFDPTEARKHGYMIELFNTGKTPAYNVRFVGKMKIMTPVSNEINLLEEYPVEFPEGEGNRLSIIASQGSSYGNVFMEERLEATEIDELFANESRRLYVWGRAEYFDIFKIRRTFSLAFSTKPTIRFVDLLSQAAQFRPDAFVTEQCKLGNDAD